MSRLTVAAAQPRTIAYEVAANCCEHAAAVRAAKSRVVLFPEMSLTGYHLDAPPLSPDDGVLDSIAEACADTRTVALAGAPVCGQDGNEHIAVLRIDSDGVHVAYRKRWLGEAERIRFVAGDVETTLQIDGWLIGLGICRDTGIEEHVRAMDRLGIDLYAAGLVWASDQHLEQTERAAALARRWRAYVAFASFAGPTGGGYARTAGRSGIWTPGGELVEQADERPGRLVRVALDRRP